MYGTMEQGYTCVALPLGSEASSQLKYQLSPVSQGHTLLGLAVQSLVFTSAFAHAAAEPVNVPRGACNKHSLVCGLPRCV